MHGINKKFNKSYYRYIRFPTRLKIAKLSKLLIFASTTG